MSRDDHVVAVVIVAHNIPVALKPTRCAARRKIRQQNTKAQIEKARVTIDCRIAEQRRRRNTGAARRRVCLQMR